ncbi:biotin--[acetyl-CoA-carboxylase] ligase [Hoyosella sp. YIM 151337]|uniref:biotin--[acetyl-CoA-carboxylase] ligase n=1 Tax=Hoyosella sp. YIM 151337 TaxID=2992742 RepID=UPI002235E4FC|nr:biotin--[acetyl-CoA-carboxylase] ligase [Hoyosella sp. YIM 151337]MCW4352337.1 biotin--[acetyl-CoA-carboxylase] ligase [Hoyosella sp. YIM 151337]
MTDPRSARLSAEKIRSALAAQSRAAAAFWRTIDVVDETGSTNADLLSQARDADAAADRAVLLAEQQTAGRGRHQRSWVTRPGSALIMSVLVHPDRVDTARLGWIPLLTGVSVARALRETTGVAADLKWPNDVLVGERKLAGILAEVATKPKGGPGVVVGFGINVDLAAADLPVPTATSLAVEGVPGVDRNHLAAAVLKELGLRLDRWVEAGGSETETAAEYVDACVTLGQLVRVILPSADELVGRAERIDASGCLVVRPVTGGDLISVSAGDVTHVRAAE